MGSLPIARTLDSVLGTWCVFVYERLSSRCCSSSMLPVSLLRADGVESHTSSPYNKSPISFTYAVQTHAWHATANLSGTGCLRYDAVTSLPSETHGGESWSEHWTPDRSEEHGTWEGHGT